MIGRATLTSALLLASIGWGCGPQYDGLVIQRVSGNASGTLSDDLIELPEGAIVVAKVELRSATRTDFSPLDLELVSDDPSIMTVARGDELPRWVFVGLTGGQTCIEVFAEDESVDCIDATVVTP